MNSLSMSRFSRVRFCHLPTPLELLPTLSKILGGPNIFIKRDDCTGLAGGGNKSRKLEFIFADALRNGADTVVTQGDVQSNHMRQTAAAASRMGLACEGVLARRVEDSGPTFEFDWESGNVFLDRLFNANLRFVPGDTDMIAAIEEVAEELRAKGKKPFIIPGGGNTPQGAMGYVNCAIELMEQAREMSLRIDHVVHTTGGTTTQAGFVVGFHGLDCGVQLYGISSSYPKAVQEEKAFNLAQATADFAGIRGAIPRDRIVVDSGFVGPGYGLPTAEMVEAITMTARYEGILLDPVYTGKSMAGLISLIRNGYFKKTDNVVYVHTGGVPALFAYRSVFSGK